MPEDQRTNFQLFVTKVVADDQLKMVYRPIYVTGGRFDRTGPLACLSPFPVWY